MARIGKISVIKKDLSNDHWETMEKSLWRKGLTLFPGTRRTFCPARNPDGSYRTGLTPDLQRELESQLGDKIDLSPRSTFWNVSLPPDPPGSVKVDFHPLYDKDNIFNLDDPMQAITYYWLKAHPMIASSLQEWEEGKCSPDVQFYVNDESYEEDKKYQKAMALTQAIQSFTAMSVEKRKKVIRLMGVNVSEDSREVAVFNIGHNLLNQATMNEGPYKGQVPLNVFNKFAEMDAEELEAAHLVTQCINHQILRIKAGGSVYEGDFRIAQDKETLIERILDIKGEGQDIRLDLEKKLKVKLIADVK